MNVTLSTGNIVTRPAGVLALGILEGERKLSGAAAAVDRAARGAISRVLATRDFTGRFLDVAVLYPTGVRAKRVMLVGLGRAGELTAERVRAAAALAARRARSLGAGTVVTVAHGAGRGGLDPAAAALAVAEGSILGPHRFTDYLKEPGPLPLKRVQIVERDQATARRMRPAVARGTRWAESACLARDLAATPGQDLTPERLGARALEIAKKAGARGRVMHAAQLEKLGMGAVLAVGRGSVNPPCFIELERPASGARTKRTVVVIGKGVTFDTGGISIKPRENMGKMKYDMSGAAAVLGLFHALPTLDLPFRVIGLVPSAENMPGGRALKPGDVIRALDGTTIEVTNTDAEGRLLLADALAYAQRFEPEAVVDLATLTGAISIALGNRAAGLFTRDDAIAAELLAAGEASGERLWRLPLWEAYEEDMKSDVADLLNSAGTRAGGSILGATFLVPFAGRMPWAHLDIAGVGWADGDQPHAVRGPVGFGVRLLLEWLSRRAANGAS